MGLGKLANLEITHILSLFSHINFHLVLIYWRNISLRISNTGGNRKKRRRFSCTFDPGLHPSVDAFRYALDLFSKREQHLLRVTLKKAAIPAGFLPWGESGVQTNKLPCVEACLLSGIHGWNCYPGKLLPRDSRWTHQMTKNIFQWKKIAAHRSLRSEWSLFSCLLEHTKRLPCMVPVQREATAWAWMCFSPPMSKGKITDHCLSAFWHSDGAGRIKVYHR